MSPRGDTRFELDVADCCSWLAGIEDGSVALCVTDPAYESLEKHRAHGTTTRLKQSKASSNAWFPIFHNPRFPELLGHLYRVLARDAHLYVLSDQETMIDVVRPDGRAAGFTWWKGLVWEKVKTAADAEGEEPGPSAGMGYHYRAAHEMISFLEKGKRRLSDLGICDVIRAPRVRGGYPTEKPVSLLRTLVEQSSSPGELVIDPFLGSGATGEAAISLGRPFAGCDVVESAVQGASARLLAAGGVSASGLYVRRAQRTLL